MKKSILRAAALVWVAGLVACSGSSGGVVGTWVVDVDKTVPPLVDQLFAAIPPEQRKMMESMTPEMKASIPAEQREAIEAMSSPEKMKAKLKKDMASSDMEVKSDGTFVSNMKMKDLETYTGTWVEKDGAVTFTPKTHNGKPAEGNEARPLTAKWEGAQLVVTMEPPKEGAGIPTMKFYYKKK